MNLKQLVTALQTYLEANPTAGDMPAVFRTIEGDFTFDNTPPFIEGISLDEENDDETDCVILCSNEPE
jgi:hypothetical protein